MATAADLRSLRRWLVVAAVWSVAATAIAVLAFLTASDDDDQRIADSSDQARRIQRQLDRQLDQLESRVAAVPGADDVANLSRRIDRLGRVASRQDRQLRSVDTQLRQLRTRLDEVEATAADALEQAQQPAATESP